MAELSAAALAGTAFAVAVLALGRAGAPLRFPRLEARVADRLGRLVAAEAGRAEAAGLRLGAGATVGLELLLAGCAGTAGYLLTGMPVLAVAAAGLGLGALRGLLAARATSLRRERQDAVLAAVRTLRQLLETGAVGVSGALEVLAQRGPAPLRAEFQAVVAGGLGPVAWALARRRVGEPVFDLLSTAILVQRPGGGELGPLFRELEESVTAAHEVEREATAMQVQARSASTLILSLPLAFLAVMCLLRSPYLDVYRALPGQLFLAAMLAVMAAAHVLIRRWLRLPEEPRLELADV
jgi:Flp pilus assembly protein TadB